MKKLFLGSSPLTSIFGIVEGCILAMIPVFQKNGYNLKDDWIFLVGAIVVYLRGRKSKDTNGITAEESKIVHEKILTNGI